MERVVLHSDLNGFYASVECVHHPEIRHLPVAVCGDPAARHGIILAKNEAAKAFGIKTGHVIWEAKQLCPNLVLVRANFEQYIMFSEVAKRIYHRYTSRVESFGIDECWLDVSGCCGSLFDDSAAANSSRAANSNSVSASSNSMPAKSSVANNSLMSASSEMAAKSSRAFEVGRVIADEIRAAIRQEMGITASVGVSWNKIFAKLGSDLKKPDATTVITRQNYRSLLFDLPVSDLLMVGKATKIRLNKYGIFTIGQLAATDPDFLAARLGKWGRYLWTYANGSDTSPVAGPFDASSGFSGLSNFGGYKSYGKSDNSDFSELSNSNARKLSDSNLMLNPNNLGGLSGFDGKSVDEKSGGKGKKPDKSVSNSTTTARDLKTADEVRMVVTVLAESVAARLREGGAKGWVVHLWLRDNRLDSWGKQVRLSRPTSNSADIIRAAMQLFLAYDFALPLRSVGVRVAELCAADSPVQLDMFVPQKTHERRDRLEQATDEIRGKFGHFAFRRGIELLNKELTDFDPKTENVIHPDPFL